MSPGRAFLPPIVSVLVTDRQPPREMVRDLMDHPLQGESEESTLALPGLHEPEVHFYEATGFHGSSAASVPAVRMPSTSDVQLAPSYLLVPFPEPPTSAMESEEFYSARSPKETYHPPTKIISFRKRDPAFLEKIASANGAGAKPHRAPESSPLPVRHKLPAPPTAFISKQKPHHCPPDTPYKQESCQPVRYPRFCFLFFLLTPYPLSFLYHVQYRLSHSARLWNMKRPVFFPCLPEH